MKGICFAFDAFCQWSEHDRNKMKWRMKVGIEGRPSMAGRPKIVGWPATFSLLSFVPPLSTPLAQPPHVWDKVEGQWPHELAGRPATILGRPTTTWLPYKRVAKGSLLLHPASSQATSSFLNPSPSY
jgi:hypothetical protein